jgi:PPOX class probable F420-dependent enzyme
MGGLNQEIREFLDAHIIGVVATQGPDGEPRQSLVYYARDGDRLLISTLANRLKARDVRRSGWASLTVMGHERPFPSATLSGPAEIATEGIGPATASIAQRVTGAEEPPEPMSDEALSEAGRVVLAITIDRVGPVSYIGG